MDTLALFFPFLRPISFVVGSSQMPNVHAHEYLLILIMSVQYLSQHNRLQVITIEKGKRCSRNESTLVNFALLMQPPFSLIYNLKKNGSPPAYQTF